MASAQPHSGVPGWRDGWLGALERHLDEQGMGRSGVAADAVGRLQRGGVREEELRGEGSETRPSAPR